MARVRELRQRGLLSQQLAERYERWAVQLRVDPIDVRAPSTEPELPPPALTGGDLDLHPLRPKPVGLWAEAAVDDGQPLAPLRLGTGASAWATAAAMIAAVTAASALALVIELRPSWLDPIAHEGEHWRIALLLLVIQTGVSIVAGMLGAPLVSWAVSRASFLRIGYGHAWLMIAATALAAGMAACALGAAALPLVVPLALWQALWMRDQAHEVAVPGRRLLLHLFLTLAIAAGATLLLGADARVHLGRHVVQAPARQAPTAPALDALDYDMIAVAVGATSAPEDASASSQRDLLGEQVPGARAQSRYALGADETALELDFDSAQAARSAMRQMSAFRDPSGETRSGIDEAVTDSSGSGFDDDWTTQVTTIARSGRRIIAFVYRASGAKSQSDRLVRRGQAQHQRLLDALSEQLT